MTDVPARVADGDALLSQMHRTVWRFAAISALVSIGVPEQLRHGPLAVTELARRCGAHPPTLARLLRTGATTGLLRTAGPGTYALTEAGQALLDGPEVLRVKWCALPEMWGALGELTETVRTGQAPFASQYGSTYGFLSGHPEAAAAFDASMVANHGDLAARLAGVGDLAGVRTLADIGGGRGAFLASVLRAHPDMRGILLDLDHTVPAAKEYLATAGVRDRAEVIAGDFFASVPAGADAYLLAFVIHNFDDARAVAVLRNVRAAMPDRGRVLLVEAILPDDDTPHPRKDLDVRIASLEAGGERTRGEYSALLAEAGLGLEAVTELASSICLIAAGTAKGA